MLRPIVKIDEEKCDGCGKCILDCAEGALEIVAGKARLVSETYCDGLGACLNCPRDAISLEMKEAPAFDEHAALAAKVAKSGKRTLSPLTRLSSPRNTEDEVLHSQLATWPIQLALVPARAKFLDNSNLLLCAQCAGFALPDINEQWLKDHVPLIACPKLQDHDILAEKLATLMIGRDFQSISVLRMSVPCCGALASIMEKALKMAGKDKPFSISTVNLS